MAFTLRDDRLHIRLIGSEQGYADKTLCGVKIYHRVWIGCFREQVKSAINSSADICVACRAFYERNALDFVAAEIDLTVDRYERALQEGMES